MPETNDVNFNICCQQVGVTALTDWESIQLPKALFPNRLISPVGDVAWTPRSPDLAPVDFFLWEYLKKKVSVNRSSNLVFLVFS